MPGIFGCPWVDSAPVAQEWGFLVPLCPALPSPCCWVTPLPWSSCTGSSGRGDELDANPAGWCRVLWYEAVFPLLPVYQFWWHLFHIPLNRSCDTLQHTKPGWFLKWALQSVDLCEKTMLAVWNGPNSRIHTLQGAVPVPAASRPWVQPSVFWGFPREIQ